MKCSPCKGEAPRGAGLEAQRNDSAVASRAGRRTSAYLPFTYSIEQVASVNVPHTAGSLAPVPIFPPA